MTIAELLNNEVTNTNVSFAGWVRTRRDSKAGFSFLGVYDGSCFNPIQVIAEKSLPNYTTEIMNLTCGCSIEVTGKLVSSPAKGQKWEVQATAIKLIGGIDNPETYPMQPKRHTMEHLREHAHLRPRTNLIGAMSRIRQTVSFSIHNFFNQEGFLWINTPLITASDCEGAGEMFQITTLDLQKLPYHNHKIDYQQDFFARQAFLTVSGQLNAEAYAQALGKIYTFGPTFRAENSNTSRHLAEFWMIEPEISFADLDDLSVLAEKLLIFVCNRVLEKCQEDINFFTKKVDANCQKRIESMISTPFMHMDYTSAINILTKAKRSFQFPIKWGVDLASEHERFLTEEHLKAPVIIKNYPKEIKSFYMRENEDGKTVAAMDVLVPKVGEIIGGSQREERYEILKAKMLNKKMNIDDYQWYLDLRRYGTSIHSGFGLGLERLLSYITGVGNIRETIPFPRTPKNIDF